MSSSKGVVVDTWFYVHKAVVVQGDDEEDGEARRLVEDRRVEVKVRLIKKTGNAAAPPFPTEAVSFSAECTDPRIRVEGTDIEAIRKAVFSQLDKALAIKWEPHLLVRVQRPFLFETGSGVEVTWSEVYKGTAWDGSLLLREFRSHSKEIWVISPWPGAFSDKYGKVMACLPATEANRAALTEFARRLDDLRKRIAEFLSPGMIVATLANLRGMAFLPPPPAGVED